MPTATCLYWKRTRRVAWRQCWESERRRHLGHCLPCEIREQRWSRPEATPLSETPPCLPILARKDRAPWCRNRPTPSLPSGLACTLARGPSVTILPLRWRDCLPPLSLVDELVFVRLPRGRINLCLRRSGTASSGFPLRRALRVWFAVWGASVVVRSCVRRFGRVGLSRCFVVTGSLAGASVVSVFSLCVS